MTEEQSRGLDIPAHPGLQQATLGLLGALLFFAARHLYFDLRLRDGTLDVIAPGGAAPRVWRAVSVCWLLVALGFGACAVRWRATSRGRMYAILASICALLAFLSEHRILGEFGRISANALPYCCGVATIISAYRASPPKAAFSTRSLHGDVVWIGATLYAIAVALLFRIFSQTPSNLPGHLMSELLIFGGILLFMTTGRPTRLAAMLASGLGTAGAMWLVLLTFFPMVYVGLLGFAMLRSITGWLFYAASIGGIWAFHHHARQVRSELDPPTSDRWLGIPAGIAVNVAVVTIYLFST